MPLPETDIAGLLQALLYDRRQVTDLVGGRIRPDVLEENEKLPAIRYEVMTTDEQNHLDGASGYAFTRIQFDSYGRTRREANQVAAAVRDVLHGFRGSLDSDHTVDDCMLDNQYDRRDPPPKGSGQWRYRRTQDYLVSHTTPVPSLPTE